ncbi:MAG: hypothetical protein EXR50_04805 [Dehalococcoidia bacterium]|nr:hypothetical protein [Dehalococcoidia bacterium]
MRDPGSQAAALIDSIIESGELIINDRVRWEQREGHLKARLSVISQRYPGFRLELGKSLNLPRFTLQLTFNTIAARRYCSNNTHSVAADCPDYAGQRLQGPHKHRWSDETGDECIYVPDDISPDSLEKAFYDFCAESGIIFNGVWIDPPLAQLGLEVA